VILTHNLPSTLITYHPIDYESVVMNHRSRNPKGITGLQMRASESERGSERGRERITLQGANTHTRTHRQAKKCATRQGRR